MNTNTEHINIFIAYSRKDEVCLKRLRTGLKPLDRRNADVTIWFDGEIEPGAEWNKTIKTHLRKADIILLLVSMDALASDYFYDDEMQEALARHDQQQAIVIPVILRTCDWEDELGHLQALPKDGKPVTAWTHEDDAYTDIMRGVKRSIKDIRNRRNQTEAKRAAAIKAAEQERLQKEKAAAEKAAKIAALPTPIQALLHDMIYVQGGTFQMGSNKGHDSEKPIHPVTLDDFKIGKYPITQAQYQAVMDNDNPSHFKGNDKRPVEMVSWHDAQEFTQKLNKITGEKFRLPTEAEWEFAARGGTKSKGFKYAGSDNVDEVAWYYENSRKKGKDHPTYGTNPVGTKAPNELNIHDMSGNVWEWCEDWYDENYYKNSPQNNAKGPTSEQTYRVLRGGSWFFFTDNCRVANRNWYRPFNSSVNVGFRLAQTL